MSKRYYFKSRSTNSYVYIEHGRSGFIPADGIKSQDDANRANISEGVSEAQVFAAEICAISGNWSVFDEISKEASDQ